MKVPIQIVNCMSELEKYVYTDSMLTRLPIVCGIIPKLNVFLILKTYTHTLL